MAKKQGDYDKEDESLAAKYGKGSGTKKERDLHFGKWNNRQKDKKDWKKAKSGAMITAKVGTMIKAKKGFGR